MTENGTKISLTRKGLGSDSARLQRNSALSKLLKRPELGAVSGAVLIYIIFYFLAGESGMFTVKGIIEILQVSAEIGILAAAASLLMIAGEFDLSMGSMIGFAGVIIGLASTVYHLPLSLAILLSFVICAGIGALNGWLTAKTGLPSFIVTLASMLILRGEAISETRAISGYTQISKITASDPDSFVIPLFSGNAGQSIFSWMANHHWIDSNDIGQPTIAGVPASILWWIGLTILATWVLLRTRIGNWIFAIGGEETSARNVGVPVDRVKIILFMVTAMSAVLFATIQIMQVGSTDTLRGTQKEFDAIIAVVIGGTLLTGGYGSAIGAFLGALIYGTVQMGIIYTRTDADRFKVFLGVMVLLAVLFNNYIRRRATLSR
jgi:simple sugar transport system permease protein